MILWQKYRKDENINFAAKIFENCVVDYIKALSVAYRAAWEIYKKPVAADSASNCEQRFFTEKQ